VTLLDATLAATTAVYRLYDAAGMLLYVGVAIDPEVRLACHAREKAWWEDADQDRTRIEWHPDRLTALTAEMNAIESEGPVHNVTGTTRLPTLRANREPRSYDDIRRVRIGKDRWDAYTEIVGDMGRSGDLKAYIEWRLDNPNTPLA
jgi:predicted GIY-YIG superfamily endonuclease